MGLSYSTKLVGHTCLFQVAAGDLLRQKRQWMLKDLCFHAVTVIFCEQSFLPWSLSLPAFVLCIMEVEGNLFPHFCISDLRVTVTFIQGV